MEMSVGRLAELQQQIGHQVLMAAAPGSPLWGQAGIRQIPAIGLGETGPWDLPGIARLARTIGSFNPEVIHVHYSKDLHRVVPANLISGKKPLVLTKQLGSAVAKRGFWHRFLYSNVSRATAISTFIRNNLDETTVLKRDQIDLVYLGTDTTKFLPETASRNEVRRELGFGPKETVIGMMGRLSPGKGFEDFMEAVSGLSQSRLRFLMIGGASRGEEPYAEGLRKEAGAKLGKRLVFLGFKPDRERYLRAMDIFAFPSHAESFGLALCEAMATGLPCVAYAKDGVLDIIEDGVNGLRARVREPGDLRQKLGILISDGGLRKRLGATARKTVERKFSEPGMLAGYQATYRKAMEDAGS
jgi:glycosyltransferase involved in cell wall biosynthesis